MAMHQIAEHNARVCAFLSIPSRILLDIASRSLSQDERTDGAQVVVNDLPQILRFLCVVLPT